MAVVDELVTILGIKLATDALGKLKAFKDGVAGISKELAGLGVLVTGTATAAGLFINKVVNEAAELDKLSQKTGISTDALQEWQYAATAAGVDAKAVTNDLVNMQKTMASPIPGQFNATLAMFGVSARDASGKLKTTDKVLEDMAGKFAKMDAQKAAQWASKLGISDETLLLLRKGKDGIETLRKEAHKLGGVIPNNAIKQAAEFKRNLTDLQFALKGITSMVALAMVPAFGKIVTAFKDWIGANQEWIQLGLGGLMAGLVSGFERFFAVLKGGARFFDPLIDALGQFLPDMEFAEVVTHFVTGALSGLLLIFAPLIAKFALIGVAVAAVAFAFEDFFTFIEGGDSLVGRLFEAFEKKWPALFAMIKKLGAWFKENVIEVLGIVKDVAMAVGDAFLDVFSGILNGLDSIAGPISDFFENFGENFPALAEVLRSFANVVKTIVVAAFDMLVDTIKKAVDVVFKIVEQVGGAVKAVMGWVEKAARMLGFGPEQTPTEVAKEEGEAGGTEEKPEEFKEIAGNSVTIDGKQVDPDSEEALALKQQMKESAERAQKARAAARSAASAKQSAAQAGGSLPGGGKSDTGTAGKSGASQSTTINDNKTVTINVATSDPAQAAQMTANAVQQSNINTPGQYASAGF